MKLSKNLGRVATTFLATAMLASVTAVPAFAETTDGVGDVVPENGVTLDSGTTEHTIKLAKYLSKPANVYIPDATFEFSIAPSTTNPDVHTGMDINDAAKMGTDDSIETTSSEQSDATKLPAGTYKLTDTADIELVAENFDEPGEYYFTVTESNGQYENGQEWTTNTLTLKVIVVKESVLNPDTQQNEEKLCIYGYSLYDEDNPNDKLDGFTNEYLGGTDGTPYTYTVEKEVTGNMATSADKKTAHFEFDVDIDNNTLGENGTKTYYVTVNHADGCTGTTTTYNVSANSSAQTIAIANGETFTIYGLTANDKLTVTEKGVSTSEGTSTGAGFGEFTVTNTVNSSNGKTTGQQTAQ